MSVVTYCKAERGSRWHGYHGYTIEQACKERASRRLNVPHQTERIHWRRDDGSHGTVTATLRHEIEITGMRGIDPGEGWRLLRKDEPLREGDQYWSNVNGRWMRSDNAGCSHKSQGAGLTYRRRIEPEPKRDTKPLDGSTLAWSILHKGKPVIKLTDLFGSQSDGWRRHCPSVEELADEAPAWGTERGDDADSGADVFETTGKGLRLNWGECYGQYFAWMPKQPKPAPAEPPYEPPSGWVEIDPADESTWPTELDEGEHSALLADHNGRPLIRSAASVRNYPHAYRRWRTVQGVMEADP